MNVGDGSDDGGGEALVVVIPFEALAEGTAAVEDGADEFLVHEDDEGRTGMVSISEVTAAGDGDAHGAEVVRIGGAGLRSGLVSLCRLRLAGRPNIENEMAGGKGADGSEADGFNAGCMTQLVLEGIVKPSDHAGFFGVAAAAGPPCAVGGQED